MSEEVVARQPVTPMSVMAWELRRLVADRNALWLLGGLGVFFAAVVIFKHEWLLPVNDATRQFIPVEGTTAFGEIYVINSVLLVFFGLLVPFLTADAVARDRARRVHELLMTSGVSREAYVWGRFAAALFAVLITAVVMAVASQIALFAMHVTEANFPEPNLGAFVVGWLLLIVPAAIVMGSISFSLGTLWPRFATAVKVAVVLGWIGLSFVVDIGHNLGWTWFEYWNPSSTGMVLELWPWIVARYVGSGATAASALSAQQQLPSLSAWIVPHVGISLIALVLVALAAARFGRFQREL
jgi:ABC-type transport system involved in multi-copper enzyme maturation permease subunit